MFTRARLRFAAAVVAFTMLAASQSPSQSASAEPPSTDGLPCSTFVWGTDANSDRSTMQVPIELSGKTYWYQFDTGADVVIVYGNHRNPNRTPRADGSIRVPGVKFGGMSLPAILVYPLPSMSDSGKLKGTVGLDILVGHTLVIDFPKQRICMMNRADVPEALYNAADWTPAQIRNGKFYVAVSLNGTKLNSVLYDSGTSPDQLAVDLDAWRQATGKAGPADATTHKFAQSWGRRIEIVGASATGDLVIGKHRYAHPMLTTIPSRPSSYRNQFFGAQGALGNALFFHSIVIVDLWSHPQFGIISR